jgi:hypothetical protein
LKKVVVNYIKFHQTNVHGARISKIQNRVFKNPKEDKNGISLRN